MASDSAAALDAGAEHLVRGLVQGHPESPTLLYQRYAPYLQRVLARIIGFDSELEDLLHEVFARALRDVRRLRQPERLRPWLASIAVFTARSWLRRRSRRRLTLLGDHTEQQGGTDDLRRRVQARQDLERAFRLLDRLPTDERIAFCLRQLEGMELTEVAAACNVSLATAKRKIKRGEEKFLKLARRDPRLCDRLKTEQQL